MSRSADTLVRVAILQVGTIEVAVHLLRVVEILSARPLLNTGRSATLLGLLSLRGQLLPVFHLHRLMVGSSVNDGAETLTKRTGQYVLVVAGGREFVIAVTRLREVFDAPLRSLVPTPLYRGVARATLVCGAVLFEKREIPLLDLVSLAEQHDVFAAEDQLVTGSLQAP